MYKKTYLSFRFITCRPLCQIEQGDQTDIIESTNYAELGLIEAINRTKE